jgi:hypothetical protein
LLVTLLAELSKERLGLAGTEGRENMLANWTRVLGDIHAEAKNTYFLKRFPLISLSFFVQGLIISSEGET